MSTSSHDIARTALAAMTDADILRLFTKAVEEESGALIVTVTTPSGHSGSLGSTVASALLKKTGKTVTIVEKADSSLIGGVIISYGDERIDMSVRRTLDDAQFLLTKS